MKTKIAGFFFIAAGICMAWSVHSGYEADRKDYDRLRESYVREVPLPAGRESLSDGADCSVRREMLRQVLTDDPTSRKQLLSDKSKLPERREDGRSMEQETQTTLVDWKALKEENPDTAAWLTIPSLKLSYPVVQGVDNEYYLRRSFRKEENYAGCIFLDVRNRSDFGDPVSVIYGHNMRDGSMFGSLKDLKTAGQKDGTGMHDDAGTHHDTEMHDFAEVPDSVQIITPERVISCEVCSVQTVQIMDDRALFPPAPADICGRYDPKSGFRILMPLPPLICLITCTGHSDWGERLAVFCKVTEQEK